MSNIHNNTDNLEIRLIDLTTSQLKGLIKDTVQQCLNDALPEYASAKPDEDELLTVQQAAEFLNLTVATIYGKVHKNELPFMKRSKRLYFSKVELTDYLKQGRVKTQEEIQAEATQYTQHKKKGGLSYGG